MQPAAGDDGADDDQEGERHQERAHANDAQLVIGIQRLVAAAAVANLALAASRVFLAHISLHEKRAITKVRMKDVPQGSRKGTGTAESFQGHSRWC